MRPDFRERAKRFIEEVVALEVKYDLNLGHEDSQGAFELSDEHDPDYADWLAASLYRLGRRG